MDLYRYEDTAYASMCDDWAGHSTHIRLSLETFAVLKETAKGYWIAYTSCHRKWVSKSSKKRFAHPTADEAWNSFKKRKEAQMRIYREKLRRAQVAYSLPRPDAPVHYTSPPCFSL